MASVDFPLPAAGDLNKRVLIRLRSDGPIGLASIISQYPSAITRWAKLSPVGTAVWAASVQTSAQVTHRCVIRYVNGITDDHEIVHKGRVYRVRRCADLQGAGLFLVLEVEEIGDELESAP